MWTAIYEDGSRLTQFEENGDEHLFSEIDQDKLSLFEIRLKDHIFGVSLQEGAFRIDEVYFNFEGFKKEDKFKFIYFRRVRQTLGVGTNTTQHCIGWQLEGNEDKPNQKRILKVMEENLKITFETK